MSWAPGKAPPFGFCTDCPDGTVLEEGMLEEPIRSSREGRWLPAPLLFGDDTPQNRACLGDITNVRKALESTIVQKWKDVQNLPAMLPPVVLQGTEEGFRRRLHKAQLACTETASVIAVVRMLLDGGSRTRLLEAEKIAKG